MLRDAAEEFFNKIKDANSQLNAESIPQSDIFFKKIESLMGLDMGTIKKIISILRDSHKILIMELQKEDRDHEVKRVEGYVEADLMTVRRLKAFYHTLLEEGYNKHYKTNKMIGQIMKEIFPQLNMLKNTPLGQIANKSIMLVEFEKFIEKDYTQFSPEWKEQKFTELINLYEIKKQDVEESTGTEEHEAVDDIRRAVDSDKYQNFTSASMTKSINKLLQIYGVDFFFRVYLRKYDFEFLTNVIEAGHINKRSDLKLLKDMLRAIRINFDNDNELINHSEQLYHLERAVTRMMLFKHG